MKKSIFVLTILLFFGCGKHDLISDEKNNISKKDYFSLTEFQQKTDSLKNIASNEGFEVLDITNDYNPDYTIGKIHILIEDENRSFFVMNKYNPNSDCDCAREEDSLAYINFSIDAVKNSKEIKTGHIIKILEGNKDSINRFENPIIVSFALKNDTVQGDFLFNVIDYLDKNGLNHYFFRKANQKELEKIETFKSQ